jgi:hypothetical protein
MTMLGTYSAPGGYCTNTGCASDPDCGTNGYCTSGGLCLGKCSGANQCQAQNANNRCFYADTTNPGACLPSSASNCDPTQFGTCGGTNACNRSGFDNVGDCLTTCTFGQTCANDAMGNAQVCDFLNNKVDGQGNATSDIFQGLACILRNGTATLGTACTYLNDCLQGFECDIYSTKVCKQLCRFGSADCTSGGTCTNSYKLTTFTTGSIGLCI